MNRMSCCKHHLLRPFIYIEVNHTKKNVGLFNFLFIPLLYAVSSGQAQIKLYQIRTYLIRAVSLCSGWCIDYDNKIAYIDQDLRNHKLKNMKLEEEIDA